MNNSFSLADIPVDAELTAGARNAIQVCLRVQPGEKVTLITDEASLSIGASLAREVEAVGARHRAWVLEELAPRPLEHTPREILEDYETSQVSIFAALAQPHELRARMQMTDAVTRRAIRHAHMVNINRQIMMEGMRADFHRVDEISTRVRKIASAAHSIHARTAAGTDLTAELNPGYRWIKTSGMISPEKWGNLPGGEVFTTPGEVNGAFVIDGVVGDYLCQKFGDLRHEPLWIRIQANRLVEASSTNRELEQDFWQYTHTDENSDRVGEFAIGTNIALDHVIGHILQDEKIPGIHMAFGDPYGEHTGAPWRSTTHIDVVGTEFDVWADDRQIMRRGRFTLDDAFEGHGGGDGAAG
jgi:aminopeptidase